MCLTWSGYCEKAQRGLMERREKRKASPKCRPAEMGLHEMRRNWATRNGGLGGEQSQETSVDRGRKKGEVVEGVGIWCGG